MTEYGLIGRKLGHSLLSLSRSSWKPFSEKRNLKQSM